MFAFVLPSFARFCIAMKFGIAIAARIPMITTTIISSISVKPFSLRMTLTPPRESWGRGHPYDGSSRTPGKLCNRYAGFEFEYESVARWPFRAFPAGPASPGERRCARAICMEQASRTPAAVRRIRPPRLGLHAGSNLFAPKKTTRTGSLPSSPRTEPVSRLLTGGENQRQSRVLAVALDVVRETARRIRIARDARGRTRRRGGAAAILPRPTAARGLAERVLE